MSVAAYVRVSSASQDLELQRVAIERVCKQRRERIDVWFSEKTGGAGARPELERLRKAVRRGEVGKVYVWRLDRLSRCGALEVLNIVKEFRAHGCKLETIDDGFSLEGPAADLVLSVMASVAEMEREAIRRRLAEARAQIEANGGHWGRPRRVDRPTAHRIRAMKKEGRTVRQIAVALKIPKSTIARALSQKDKAKPLVKAR